MNKTAISGHITSEKRKKFQDIPSWRISFFRLTSQVLVAVSPRSSYDVEMCNKQSRDNSICHLLQRLQYTRATTRTATT